MTEQTNFYRFPRLGYNRSGIAVYGRLTQTITVDCFNGRNPETDMPRFRSCSTIVRATVPKVSRPAPKNAVLAPHKSDCSIGVKNMVLTLSERRLSELIRSLEGISDTDSEIAFRMQHYCSRLFAHVANDYGIRMVGMVETHGDLGSFQFDISSIGRDWQTGDFDWQKLIGGLQFLNPVAVTVEARDMEAICTGLVATGMIDNWNNYAPTLQRLSVSQVQPAIEAACMETVWKQPAEMGGTETERNMSDLDFRLQLERSGDPKALDLLRELVHRDEVDSYQRAEEEAHKKREDAAYQARWGIDRRE
jgi:hypothetical protein